MIAREVGIVAVVVVSVLASLFFVVYVRLRFNCFSIAFEARLMFAVIVSLLEKNRKGIKFRSAAFYVGTDHGQGTSEKVHVLASFKAIPTCCAS